MDTPFFIDYLFNLRWSICLLGIASLIFIWALKPKQEKKYLWIILLIGLFTQIRFGTLHNGFFLHAHDCIHYQIGSKYFKEMGYKGIYAGLTQALKELNQTIPSIEAPKTFRDLDNKTGEHLNADSQKTLTVKDRFSEKRWQEFKNDIVAWENKYKPDWKHIVSDAGYNPPPAWTVWGLVANYLIYPTNSVLYGIPDVIVYAIIFYLLWTAFGYRAALYPMAAMMFFPGGTYAPFDWIGGSLFRFLWVLWITFGIVYYYRKNYRLAGFMFSLAAMERIFPAAWALSAGVIAILHLIQFKKTLGWKAVEPLKGLVLGGTMGVSTVLILSHLVLGIGTWGDFIYHIKEHGSYIFTNHIGWTRAITFHPHMGEMGFQATNMTIFNDWNTILLERKEWLIYKILRLLFIAAILVWAWKCVRSSQETLCIAWMGAGIVFLVSMPAHYYLAGLLPILGITAKQSPRMFIGVLTSILIINMVTQMTETLGWALASIIITAASAYGLGYSISLKNKTNMGLLYLGTVIFAIVIFPNLLGDPVKEHQRASISAPEGTKTVTRSSLVKEGYEVKDMGTILKPNMSLQIRTPTSSNHNLHIRTDRYFNGSLILEDMEKKILHIWTVRARGNMFDELEYKNLPPSRNFILRWNGQENTDIGIFSIWTSPSR